MSTQVKVPDEIKKELALVSAVTGQQQQQLLVAAWREYLAGHRSEFHGCLEWAQSVLADPAQAATWASGASTAEIEDLERELQHG